MKFIIDVIVYLFGLCGLGLCKVMYVVSFLCFLRMLVSFWDLINLMSFVLFLVASIRYEVNFKLRFFCFKSLFINEIICM